jgi:lysophospholipase L1-like esterase
MYFPMNITLRNALLLFWLMAAMPVMPVEANDPELKSGDRVVLLGGTFFERMQAYGFGEAALATGFADRDITVRNLGWSGDNVFGEARALFGSVDDGFKRLERDVIEAQPTVVIVNYGGNEAHAGTAGLASFQSGLERLLDTLAETKARIIVLLPHTYEDLGGGLPSPEAYNQNLAIYRLALRDAAQRRRLAVVDLAAIVKAARSELPAGQSLTDNGVHLSSLGYRAVAPHFAAALNASGGVWHVELDASRNVLEAVGCTVQTISTSVSDALVTEVRFTVVDDVLELSQQTGYGSPTAVGQGTLQIRGLAAGNYVLQIDGTSIHTAFAESWAQGVSLTRRGGQGQAERLRREVVTKTQLYFYRYRPQNETYLLLFRKHEQGNNAAEIPQFDPLVEKQDQRIAALRRPQPRQFKLRHVLKPGK